MLPLAAIGGIGAGIQGLYRLSQSGRNRRAAKRDRRDALAQIAAQRGLLNERQASDRLRLGEAQSGLEGRVATDRLAKQGREQAYQQEQLNRAESQVSRAAKQGRRDALMSILGDVSGVVSGASLGLDELLKGMTPASEGLGAGVSAASGIGGGVNSQFGVQGGALPFSVLGPYNSILQGLRKK